MRVTFVVAWTILLLLSEKFYVTRSELQLFLVFIFVFNLKRLVPGLINGQADCDRGSIRVLPAMSCRRRLKKHCACCCIFCIRLVESDVERRADSLNRHLAFRLVLIINLVHLYSAV